MILEIVVVAAVALVVLTVLYRRWSKRHAVWILVGRPASFLFDLARADGPVNPQEREYIASYVRALFDKLRAASPLSFDPRLGGVILARAERGMSGGEKEVHMRDLSTRRDAARHFFDIACGLACIDGEMAWSEREWLEMQGTFSMLDVGWFMNVLEKKCPCSKHPRAARTGADVTS